MTVVTVRVKPNAKQQKAICLDDGSWLLHLKASPQDGKANQELVVLLAQALGISKTQVQIKAGHAVRTKRVEIDA
ncbi:DUF167 domain-containing protein [Phormidium tenue]|uniref:UPF0235 protein NIES30_01970 n=1 Tax=Phormidium tenue NIES-30 TaxID=549789 RepID=A0A1U7JAR6_9CYAN|nr:DUF167 domain-containing protein [Phormidium tenue]MBD2230324.1 DUF167 domain-containing protein [Phormidium tenue FACHB-1052]OKH50874.1 hypothetical protein NIES30_01970 [Phormidium tenue NIES-30]